MISSVLNCYLIYYFLSENGHDIFFLSFPWIFSSRLPTRSTEDVKISGNLLFRVKVPVLVIHNSDPSGHEQALKERALPNAELQIKGGSISISFCFYSLYKSLIQGYFQLIPFKILRQIFNSLTDNFV